MAGRKSDFTLTKLDDLFSTQEQRDEEKLSKIRDIPLTEIDDFPDHPFKVRDDEDMAQLIESKLTTEAIQAIMSEEKPNQREKIVLRGDRVRQLIPKNIPISQTEDFVCKALEHYNKFLRSRADRDSR